MAGKISVIGDVGVGPTIEPGARGADVIVAAAGEDVSDALRLAPAAVVVLVDATPEDVARVLDGTLLPRQRVIGVKRSDAMLATAVTAGLGQPAPVAAVLRDGEREVVLGRGGIVLAA